MTTSPFLYSVQPFQKVFVFMGMTPHKISHPFGGRAAICFYLYVAIHFLCQVAFIIWMLCENCGKWPIYKDGESSVSFLLTRFTCCLTASFHLLLLMESMVNNSILINITESFESLDHVLQNQLHIRLNPLKTRKRLFLRLGVTTIVAMLTYIVLMVWHFFPDYYSEFREYWVFLSFPKMFLRAKMGQFSMYVELLKGRLLFVQEEERKYAEMLSGCRDIEMDMTEDFIAKLQIFKETHIKIWQLTKEISKYFGISLICTFFYTFYHVTANVYWYYMATFNSTDEVRLMFKCDSILSPLSAAVLLFIACKSGDTFQKIHYRSYCIWNNIHNDGARCHFVESLRTNMIFTLIYKNTSFSANGIFSVDFNFLGKIVATGTSYVLIILQFHLQERGFNN